mmetsp:Transcript_72151/g.225009  ORF Transcript_72151/g.225009 Transcript_72151/m.225009 type:complete len:98 (-) Transcript_72151:2095-2388(-)
MRPPAQLVCRRMSDERLLGLSSLETLSVLSIWGKLSTQSLVIAESNSARSSRRFLMGKGFGKGTGSSGGVGAPGKGSGMVDRCATLRLSSGRLVRLG